MTESVHVISHPTAPAGIAACHGEHPDVPVYTASVDTELDGHACIVPGLGDGGDRLFGTGSRR